MSIFNLCAIFGDTIKQNYMKSHNNTKRNYKTANNYKATRNHKFIFIASFITTRNHAFF